MIYYGLSDFSSEKIKKGTFSVIPKSAPLQKEWKKANKTKNVPILLNLAQSTERINDYYLQNSWSDAKEEIRRYFSNDGWVPPTPPHPF